MRTLNQTEVSAVSGAFETNANSVDRIAIPTALVSGIGIGAATGAAIGGPIGAVIGVGLGAVFGISVGAAVHPIVDLVNKQ